MQHLIMNTTKLSLCFILFSIYTVSSSLHAAGQRPAAVLDTDGDPVRAGVEYYVLPVARGLGGGLTLDSTGNETCPLDVVQERREVDDGLPLTFRPVNPRELVVRSSVDQNVVFSANSICVQSTLWMLDFDESIQRYVVSTGGVVGNPGRESISNWFRIERYEGYYKIVYCPSVCSTCRPVCGDIGVFVEDGQRRLVLLTDRNDAPFRVMIKKAVPTERCCI